MGIIQGQLNEGSELFDSLWNNHGRRKNIQTHWEKRKEYFWATVNEGYTVYSGFSLTLHLSSGHCHNSLGQSFQQQGVWLVLQKFLYLNHCILNDFSHITYWKLLISILGMSGYVI